MLSFISVWIGLLDLLLGCYMLIAWLRGEEPGRISTWLTVCIYTAVLGITLAAMSWWANRKESRDTPGITGQRVQSYVAIALSAMAIGICYFVALNSRA